ncbi:MULTISPECIES: hypothetical protein [unclassified Chelatococcus]|uniref:hypothetical protein n=1 Tax=unclassified Chelatococcus TaxID=2638111 RepID=UPI001BCDDBC2|nr:MULTISPECIES: hypothetical protein [unclassified Chelatococcus]MBS7697875.1 hypothetical protein [Chelatococcus sp. YT9]MBX3558548.1 hypothetical protein [Chelatococcus sp.]
MRIALTAAFLALAVAGCQSAQDSMVDAEFTCQEAGLRPGTRAFERCANVNYSRNRQQSQDAANAVALGAAAGVIGGAVIGAASAPRYYPYYRCNRWGCW